MSPVKTISLSSILGLSNKFNEFCLSELMYLSQNETDGSLILVYIKLVSVYCYVIKLSFKMRHQTLPYVQMRTNLGDVHMVSMSIIREEQPTL